MSSAQRAVATIAAIAVAVALAIWMILSHGSSKSASPSPSSSSASVQTRPGQSDDTGSGQLDPASTDGASPSASATEGDGDGVADPDQPDSGSDDAGSSAATSAGQSPMDLTKGAGKAVSDFALATNSIPDSSSSNAWSEQVKALTTDSYYKQAYSNTTMSELDKIKAANGGGNGADASQSQGIDKSSIVVTPVVSQPQTDQRKMLHVTYRLYQDVDGQRQYGSPMSATYVLKNVNGSWKVDDVQPGAE